MFIAGLGSDMLDGVGFFESISFLLTGVCMVLELMQPI